jgi:PPM family protein phosphatase
MGSILAEVIGESDIGLVRERNEDALLVVDLSSGQTLDARPRVIEVGDRGLLVSVFDGMGGAAAGDRASQLAADVLGRALVEVGARDVPALAEGLGRAVLEANERIRREGDRDRACAGMGTTLTAAAILGSRLVLAQVGDSRAYLQRGSSFVQLTEDQSLLNELVSKGEIPREEAPLYEHSNVILQALGVTSRLCPSFSVVELRRDDLLMLCTDGLTSTVPLEEIQEAFASKGRDLPAITATLTMLARSRGGPDNTTVLLVRLDGEGLVPNEAEVGAPGQAVQARAPSVKPIVLSSIPEFRPRKAWRSVVALCALALLLMTLVAGAIILLGVT